MKVIVYNTNTGRRMALHVTTGRRWSQVIIMDDSGIRVKRVPLVEERFMKDSDYPLKKAVKHFRHAGKAFGITKAAKRAMTEGLK